MEDTSAQSHPERKSTTPKHLRSNVWKYLGFYTVERKVTNKDKAVCRLCKKQLSYFSTTTNLRTHLLTWHPTEAAETSQVSRAGATSGVQPRMTAYHVALPASRGLLPEARKNAISDKIARFMCWCYIFSFEILLSQSWFWLAPLFSSQKHQTHYKL